MNDVKDIYIDGFQFGHATISWDVVEEYLRLLSLFRKFELAVVRGAFESRTYVLARDSDGFHGAVECIEVCYG